MNDPIKTQFKYDEAEDKVLLTNSQDIEPLLKLNKKESTGMELRGFEPRTSCMLNKRSYQLSYNLPCGKFFLI